MKTYVIEREVPGIGNLKGEALRELAATSNAALNQLALHVEWVESYVADDKTFCVYRAEDETFIQKHAELSGFPANRITEITRKINPATASSI